MSSTAQKIKLIRRGILADLERIRAEPEPPAWPAWTHRDWADRQQDAGNCIVPMNLAGWLGRPPTQSETVLFSRAYAEGERRRVWWRLRANGKTYALQLRGADDD